MSQEFTRLNEFLNETIHKYEVKNFESDINEVESVGFHFEINENFEKPCVVFEQTFRKGESKSYFYIKKEEMKEAKLLLDFTIHHLFSYIDFRKLPKINNKTEFLKWWIGESFVSAVTDVKENNVRLVTFDNIDHETQFIWTGDTKELDEVLDHLCALYFVD